MKPSAPVLLSTTTIWPVRRWMASPAIRAAISAVPPGAKPTMTWIGCLGTHSARAAVAASNSGLANRLRRSMRNSPLPDGNRRARAVPGQDDDHGLRLLDREPPIAE